MSSFSSRQKRLIEDYRASHFTTKPIVQQGEEDFVLQQTETAKNLGLDDVERFALGRLMVRRHETYMAELAVKKHQADQRSKGGRAKKKLTQNEHAEWLAEGLENFKGEKAIYQKIASAIFNKYGYKVSARTVRSRVKELNLLEGA